MFEAEYFCLSPAAAGLALSQWYARSADRFHGHTTGISADADAGDEADAEAARLGREAERADAAKRERRKTIPDWNRFAYEHDRVRPFPGRGCRVRAVGLCDPYDLTMAAANEAPNAATDLFIFAGAGVSMSTPTSLPLFNWMRDALLEQLGFNDYVQRDPGAARTAKQKIVQDTAPEPFFGKLTDAGTDLSSWLVDVLKPGDARPNAARHALAELCASGAKVWTVNFDPFIEEAARALDQPLETVAWPREPKRQSTIGELLKPHDSLDGKVIITPADVLKPLSKDCH